jgi:hypothetical protein
MLHSVGSTVGEDRFPFGGHSTIDRSISIVISIHSNATGWSGTGCFTLEGISLSIFETPTIIKIIWPICLSEVSSHKRLDIVFRSQDHFTAHLGWPEVWLGGSQRCIVIGSGAI